MLILKTNLFLNPFKTLTKMENLIETDALQEQKVAIQTGSDYDVDTVEAENEELNDDIEVDEEEDDDDTEFDDFEDDEDEDEDEDDDFDGSY